MSELVVGDFVLKLAVTIEIIISGNIPCVEDVLKEDCPGMRQVAVTSVARSLGLLALPYSN